MQMDQQALRELLEFLSSSDIQELKLEGDDFRLEVRHNMPAPQAVMLPAPAAPMVADVAAANDAGLHHTFVVLLAFHVIAELASFV